MRRPGSAAAFRADAAAPATVVSSSAWPSRICRGMPWRRAHASRTATSGDACTRRPRAGAAAMRRTHPRQATDSRSATRSWRSTAVAGMATDRRSGTDDAWRCAGTEHDPLIADRRAHVAPPPRARQGLLADHLAQQWRHRHGLADRRHRGLRARRRAERDRGRARSPRWRTMAAACHAPLRRQQRHQQAGQDMDERHAGQCDREGEVGEAGGVSRASTGELAGVAGP